VVTSRICVTEYLGVQGPVPRVAGVNGEGGTGARDEGTPQNSDWLIFDSKSPRE